MNLQKITFQNNEGETLVGRLEMPADRHPHNFVIFAHCFTCTKNLIAVKNISRALISHGFAVLRFDFTGLGESDGDFADTNFSGNVSDLVEASRFLEKNYRAPTLLVGHSLGGAAVLFAAAEIASVTAVATIGAPSNPVHVKHLFKSTIPEIKQTGKAVVNLGGRDFTIKKQFLDDLETNSLARVIENMRKPILIMHSPQDDTVGIKNAEEIYLAAHHPKSFVSLDGADHLLMRKEDSLYAGQIIAQWSQRYMKIPENDALKTKHHVVASLDASDGFTTSMKVGSHFMTADEPADFGGNDYGPSPYELLSAGLSACSVMTLQMYAKRKGWELHNVQVHTSYSKTHAVDGANPEAENNKLDTFHREIQITGNLDDKQRLRLLQIADKCPVHKTLYSETQIISKLV